MFTNDRGRRNLSAGLFFVYRYGRDLRRYFIYVAHRERGFFAAHHAARTSARAISQALGRRFCNFAGLDLYSTRVFFRNQGS